MHHITEIKLPYETSGFMNHKTINSRKIWYLNVSSFKAICSYIPITSYFAIEILFRNWNKLKIKKQFNIMRSIVSILHISDLFMLGISNIL